MNGSVDWRDGFCIIGVAKRTNNADEMAARGVIASGWKEFFETNAIAKIPNCIHPGEIVSVYTNYESDHTGEYTFILGAAVAPGTAAPDGFVVHEIPAGKFMTYEAASPSEVAKVWMLVWAQRVKRSYKSDYEIHGKDGKINIFVGVV